MATKAPGCNYCRKAAVVWFHRQGSSFLRLGQRRSIRITHAACAEHESSANWTSNLQTHNPPRLEREA